MPAKNMPLLAISFVMLLQVAAAQTHRVAPTATHARIAEIHGPHEAMAPSGKAKKKLVVAIPGTGSHAHGMFRFDSVAASLGYHAISLDYKNNVITTVCRSSADPSCFDKFRQEIVFGTPVSDSVQVDSVNSIYNRLYFALKYLASQYPSEGWSSFFKDGRIIWANIITVGHSQGAGHAAYLGKSFQVEKVIALAGPQDYRDTFGSPAPWTVNLGKTPSSRYYALLHRLDPYGFERQLACDVLLSATPARDTLQADGLLAGAKGHILVTHLPVRDAHNSVMLPAMAEAWKWLLGE